MAHWLWLCALFTFSKIHIISFLYDNVCLYCLYWGLTSQSTIFQSCRDGAIASWVLTSTLGRKCVLLKDTTRWPLWESTSGPLDSESDGLPLGHRTPFMIMDCFHVDETAPLWSILYSQFSRLLVNVCWNPSVRHRGNLICVFCATCKHQSRHSVCQLIGAIQALHVHEQEHMSWRIRIPTICICENKYAEQRLCFR